MSKKTPLFDCEKAVKDIKTAILKSRYVAAKLANRELLNLYFAVGRYVSENSRNGFWGTGAISSISKRLSQELPGLRGFSEGNIKKMRLFYEAWNPYFEIRSLAMNDFAMVLLNRSSEMNDLSEDAFFSVGFTNHCIIVMKTKKIEERLFYISKCACEFWGQDKLQYYIAENLYKKQVKPIVSNFESAIVDKSLKSTAIRSFKDEYLLDFVNVEDPDEFDERELENDIVMNIKKFIMALGKDFAFIVNQYKIIVSEKEYFIDLLFFNRRLQSLVAIELKRGEFKPEYAGKLNFYLSALDEYVKLPNENPSIGIVLCKSKDKNIVEFSFRDTSKPMGVASFKTSTKLPKEYKNILPSSEELKKQLEKMRRSNLKRIYDEA